MEASTVDTTDNVDNNPIKGGRSYCNQYSKNVAGNKRIPTLTSEPFAGKKFRVIKIGSI